MLSVDASVPHPWKGWGTRTRAGFGEEALPVGLRLNGTRLNGDPHV